jgi:hypothetical protein
VHYGWAHAPANPPPDIGLPDTEQAVWHRSVGSVRFVFRDRGGLVGKLENIRVNDASQMQTHIVAIRMLTCEQVQPSGGKWLM